MPSQPSHIVVAVATCGRAVYLKTCLDSLGELETPSETTVTLLVVDNNKDGDAEEMVREASQGAREFHYLREPEPGIVPARNRALHYAASLDATHLAFLDDDEFVAPDWLVCLYQGLEKYGCGIGIGPVSRLFEVEPPESLRMAIPFVREYDGPVYPCSKLPATNNVLLRLDPVVRQGLEFDPRYSISGGSDSKFFEELLDLGETVVWVEEARVFEHVPPSRSNLPWVLRRCFRFGLNRSRRALDRSSFGLALLHTVPQAVGNIAFCLASLAASVVRPRRYTVDALCRMSISLGVLGHYFGFVSEEYRKLHGR